jgi:hypothetical protein
MVRKQKGETEKRWPMIFELQAGSGLSVRDFCAADGGENRRFARSGSDCAHGEPTALKRLGRKRAAITLGCSFP